MCRLQHKAMYLWQQMPMFMILLWRAVKQDCCFMVADKRLCCNLQASRLQHEAMYLRQQMQVLQAQAASMQEDVAVHTRSLQAANAELKAQRIKVQPAVRALLFMP